MSAELLRRAAEKLREHANAATPGPWKTGGGYFKPWELVISLDLPFVEFTNDHAGASTAEYVALMHPPVALALADLLERTAELEENLIAPVSILGRLIRVARAILREEP